MRETAVICAVGLTPRLLARGQTPNLASVGEPRPLGAVTPAVTCTAQASMLTGLPPAGHGAVANGWYHRDLAEVMFWKQSNRLVQGEKVWEAARRRDPAFTCAQLFWWFNMYAAVDWAVTPRPMYPADGRKIPDIHTHPAGLRETLQGELGTFPLFRFWGPAADITATRWIARAAARVYARFRPTLSLVYLPHLDYVLQREGPEGPDVDAELRALDEVAGELLHLYRGAGARVVVLSEYGITRVTGAVHPNRALREAGLLAVREELGRELLDAGASRAFAVADHQVAHVYVADPGLVPEVRRLLEALDGVEEVLDAAGKRARGLDHPRSGELVAIARRDRWFSYYYWLDDDRAPDFARTVDIHRKPGYDPVELFLDPALPLPRAAVAWRLLKKKLGFRTLMDVIPLEPGLVRGSHGRPADDPAAGPLLMTSEPGLLPDRPLRQEDVKGILLRHVFAA